jgi:hypothetical protein
MARLIRKYQNRLSNLNTKILKENPKECYQRSYLHASVSGILKQGGCCITRHLNLSKCVHVRYRFLYRPAEAGWVWGNLSIAPTMTKATSNIQVVQSHDMYWYYHHRIPIIIDLKEKQRAL